MSRIPTKLQSTALSQRGTLRCLEGWREGNSLDYNRVRCSSIASEPFALS
jgi:hypothetical protein